MPHFYLVIQVDSVSVVSNDVLLNSITVFVNLDSPELLAEFSATKQSYFN